jgi:hypothetical protein
LEGALLTQRKQCLGCYGRAAMGGLLRSEKPMKVLSKSSVIPQRITAVTYVTVDFTFR